MSLKMHRVNDSYLPIIIFILMVNVIVWFSAEVSRGGLVGG